MHLLLLCLATSQRPSCILVVTAEQLRQDTKKRGCECHLHLQHVYLSQALSFKLFVRNENCTCTALNPAGFTLAAELVPVSGP